MINDVPGPWYFSKSFVAEWDKYANPIDWVSPPDRKIIDCPLVLNQTTIKGAMHKKYHPVELKYHPVELKYHPVELKYYPVEFILKTNRGQDINSITANCGYH